MHNRIGLHTSALECLIYVRTFNFYNTVKLFNLFFSEVKFLILNL